MKNTRLKVLLLANIFLLLSFNILAQNNSKINIHLSSEIRNLTTQGHANKELTFLVKGDLRTIEANIKNLGGEYRHGVKNIASVTLAANKIKAFAANSSIQRLEYYQNFKAHTLNDNMKTNNNVDSVHQGYGNLPQAYTGKGVVVGIIDVGFEYDHPDFKHDDSTSRMRYMWDQRVVDSTNSSFGFGYEWDSTDVNEGLCTHNPNISSGHGTHVSGIATGNGRMHTPLRGGAYEAEIVSVSINFGGNGLFSNFVDALIFIFDKADELGLPCVINSSVGSYRGSHDGKDLVAQLIDNMLDEQNGRILVQAAGNAGRLDRMYHVGTTVNADTSFTWFKYSTITSSIYFDAYADIADFQDVNFSISVLNNNTFETKASSRYFNMINDLALFNPDSPYQDSLFDTQGTFVGIVEILAENNNGVYEMIVQGHPVNNTDYWEFSTTGEGYFDIWSSRSLIGSSDIVKVAELPNSTELPRIEYYQALDTLQSIVSSWACSDKVITVANYVNRDNYIDCIGDTIMLPDPVLYLKDHSSRGPTRDGRLKPNISASGQYTRTTRPLFTPEVVGENPPCGFYGINGGTSMAAPVVTGIVGLYLQMHPNATYADALTAIESTAKVDSYVLETPAPVPNYAWGYGKIDAYQMLSNAVIYGCTDFASINYDASAMVDDGSCIGAVYGCTDTIAINYNPLATIDNDSCEYSVNVLEQNIVYAFSAQPNPFTQQTTISYTLNEAYLDNSKIVVFDVLGQKMNEFIINEASGSFVFERNSLPSGVYFYGLMNDNHLVLTRKLIVF